MQKYIWDKIIVKIKPIPNYPGYFATKDGRIWSNPKSHFYLGRFLKPCKDSGGYLYVDLYKNRSRHRKKIHRLILETFTGPCPVGMEGCHNSGVKANNKLENLRWDTRGNNMRDAFRHGVRNHRGENNLSTKLSIRQVHVIHYLCGFPKEFSQREIGEIFGVVKATVSGIKTGKRWS